MTKRPLSAWEIKFLNEKTCSLWPSCACHSNLIKWQNDLIDPSKTFTLDELDYAEDVIYITCPCVAEHCPNRRIKMYCLQQVCNLTRRRKRIGKKIPADMVWAS